AAAASDAIELLASLGHEVEEARPDVFDDAYNALFPVVYGPGAAWIIEYWVRKLGRKPEKDEIEPRTRANWEGGSTVRAVDYALGLDEARRISRKVDAFFDRYDAWMTPTLGGPPVALGVMGGTETEPMRGNEAMGSFLMFDGELANMTGCPAMSVPLFTDGEGLPIGIHFMSRFGDEATLFRLAAQLEQAKPWADRRPEICA